jgi:dolichol-phosphate mannosyltransferase
MTTFPDWAVITPMANEEADFTSFTSALKVQLNTIGNGKVFMVIDRASNDRTPELCRELSASDPRFITVWAPENKNVVDAYLRGYREALKSNAEYILEIDSGMSHDPAEIPKLLELLKSGYDCVYGSRFMKGGSMEESPGNRIFLSKGGTFLANFLLGTRLHDMTSGYQGFRREIVKRFCSYPLKSSAHFYQTELKYLLRKYKSIEIPIHYRAPSPRVSRNAILNSFSSLFYYFLKRITFNAASL